MQATATEHASLLGGGSKRYGAVAPPRSKIQQNGRRVGAALIVVCMIGVLALLTDHRPRTGDVALDETETYAGVGTAVVTKEGGEDIIKLTLDLTLPPTHWNDDSSPICTAATTTAEDNCADRGGECYRNNATCVEGQGVFLPELCKVEGDGGDCGCCIKQPSMAPTAPTVSPTPKPTPFPTPLPGDPSAAPVFAPTPRPTVVPAPNPTPAPSTPPTPTPTPSPAASTERRSFSRDGHFRAKAVHFRARRASKLEETRRSS